MITLNRQELWSLEGKRVNGIATLTRQRRRYDRSPLTMLKDLRIEEEIEVQHLWVESPSSIARLPVNCRFRFQALVKKYQRADGSEDMTLAQVRLLETLTFSE